MSRRFVVEERWCKALNVWYVQSIFSCFIFLSIFSLFSCFAWWLLVHWGSRGKALTACLCWEGCGSCEPLLANEHQLIFVHGGLWRGKRQRGVARTGPGWAAHALFVVRLLRLPLSIAVSSGSRAPDEASRFPQAGASLAQWAAWGWRSWRYWLALLDSFLELGWSSGLWYRFEAKRNIELLVKSSIFQSHISFSAFQIHFIEHVVVE